MTIGAEEMGELLVETFHLTVGLRVVAWCEADIDVEITTEGKPDTVGELWSPIGDCIFRQTIKSEYVVV